MPIPTYRTAARFRVASSLRTRQVEDPLDGPIARVIISPMAGTAEPNEPIGDAQELPLTREG